MSASPPDPAGEPVARPLLPIGFACAAGCCLGLAHPEWLGPARGLLAAALLLAGGCRFSGRVAFAAALAAALALGVWRGAADDLRWQGQPLLRWLGLPAEFEAIVDEPAEPTYDGERLMLSVRAIALLGGEPRPLRGRLLLRVQGRAYLDAGDRIRFSATLEPPRTAGGPGQFSERRYLRGHGIAAVARVTGPPELLRRGERGWVASLAKSLRSRLCQSVADQMPGPAAEEYARLLNSLVFGTHAAPVAERLEDAFRRAGLIHLLVASGTQVSLLLGLVFLLGRPLPRPLVFVVGLVVIGLYTLVTGFEPSILRAALMGVVVLGGLVLGRQPDAGTALAVAAAGLLLHQPAQSGNIGFQLSFAATAGLIFVGVPLYRRLQPRIGSLAAGTLSFTLGAQLAVAPVLLHHFRALSLIGLLANLAAVPLAGVLVVLGLAGSLLGLSWSAGAWWLNQVSSTVLTNVVALVGSCERVPGGYRELWAVPPALLAAWIAGVAALAVALEPPRWLAWWTRPRRLVAAAALVALAVGGAAWRASRAALTVAVLDVGQGDSLFVRTPDGRCYLIDGGPRQVIDGRVIDAGADKVVPALMLLGVRRLEAVIGTHADDDHIGGLPSVLRAFPTRRLLLPELPDGDAGVRRLRSTASELDVPVDRLARGAVLELGGGVRGYVLWPPATPPAGMAVGTNNLSIVMKLVYRSHSFLLTSDLEAAGDRLLLRLEGDLGATVLKVPHQGAGDALSDPFLTAVKPRYAAISVGPNSFGHPAAATLDRLAAHGTVTHRTDLSGMVLYRSDGRTLTVRTYGRR